jgi:hypothetical protein
MSIVSELLDRTQAEARLSTGFDLTAETLPLVIGHALCGSSMDSSQPSAVALLSRESRFARLAPKHRGAVENAKDLQSAMTAFAKAASLDAVELALACLRVTLATGMAQDVEVALGALALLTSDAGEAFSLVQSTRPSPELLWHQGIPLPKGITRLTGLETLDLASLSKGHTTAVTRSLVDGPGWRELGQAARPIELKLARFDPKVIGPAAPAIRALDIDQALVSLKGLEPFTALEALTVHGPFTSLEPLQKAPLRELWCYQPAKKPLDLEALVGKQLTRFATNRPCASLEPLKGMPLVQVRVDSVECDVSPLQGTPTIEELAVSMPFEGDVVALARSLPALKRLTVGVDDKKTVAALKKLASRTLKVNAG